MKKLILALMLAASFNAVASRVGVNNLNSMNGNVNLECTSKNGDVLEVDGQYFFPQSLEIQSGFYQLNKVQKISDGKLYLYKSAYTSDIFVLGVTKKSVFMVDRNKTDYECE